MPSAHMEILLDYLYRGTYDRGHSIVTHVAMYVLADKYIIPNFKSRVIDRVKELTSFEFPKLLENIVELAVLLWESDVPADKNLRRPVMEAAVKHKDGLLKIQDFKDLLWRCGDFVVTFSDGGYVPKWGGVKDPNEPA